ncbi:MAG: M24 family metallopeptidase [Protaetiibacter sp.]
MNSTTPQERWDSPLEDLTIPVSREELERRRDAVLEAMRRDGVDVAFFTGSANAWYLTGVSTTWMDTDLTGVMLSSTGRHCYVVRRLDQGWCEVWTGQSWVDEWRVFRDEEDLGDVLEEAIRRVAGPGGPRRIGLELSRAFLSHHMVTRFGSIASEGLADVTSYVEELRAIKSPAELAHIRRAGDISVEATDAAVAALRAGATDVEAAGVAWSLAARRGGAHEPKSVVFAGPIRTLGHITWGQKAPSPGQIVSWGISGFVHNYACPIERTIVRLPDRSGALKKLEIVAGCVELLEQELHPGMTSEEGARIALEFYTRHGVAEYWLNHAAYGFGINWSEFELFRVRPRDTRILKAGMTLHVVPQLNVPGLGGLSASSAIVITDSGVERLNVYPRLIEPFV